jgi:hypothetical protein
LKLNGNEFPLEVSDDGIDSLKCRFQENNFSGLAACIDIVDQINGTLN